MLVFCHVTSIAESLITSRDQLAHSSLIEEIKLGWYDLIMHFKKFYYTSLGNKKKY